MSTIKTVWQMSGEKEYRQAISEINRGVSVLDSEMKKINAVYKENASSVEAVSAKSDVLERKLYSQREKAEKLREALRQSAEAYGESDKRTMNWQKSLNEAEAAVAETEHAIRKLNEEQQRNAEASIGAGDALDKLASKLGVNLPDGAKNSLNGMLKLNPEVVALAAGAAAAATAVVELERKLLSLSIQSAATADEILTLSMTTGLSTSTIQEMKYASGLLDVSLDTISGSLTKLTNNMQAARDGNEKLMTAFQSLGVSIVDGDGSLRRVEDVFYEIIDALGLIENATERDASAMDIFGKFAQDLNPLIIQGSDALRKLAEEAHEAGYVMNEETLQALGAVDDAFQRLQLTQEAVENQISADFAPAAERAMTDFAGFIDKCGEAFHKSGVVDSMGSILVAATGLIDPLARLIEMASESGALGLALKWTATGLAAIADTLTVIVGLVSLVPELFRGTKWKDTTLATGLGRGNTPSVSNQVYQWNRGNYYDSASNSFYQSGEINYGNYQIDVANGKFSGSYAEYMEYKRNQYGWNAGGTSNWRGGMTWVGENGPELVYLPKGSRVSTAQESRGGGDIFNISIDARFVQEFDDIVRIARTAKTSTRMGG